MPLKKATAKQHWCSSQNACNSHNKETKATILSNDGANPPISLLRHLLPQASLAADDLSSQRVDRQRLPAPLGRADHLTHQSCRSHFRLLTPPRFQGWADRNLGRGGIKIFTPLFKLLLTLNQGQEGQRGCWMSWLLHLSGWSASKMVARRPAGRLMPSWVKITNIFVYTGCPKKNAT